MRPYLHVWSSILPTSVVDSHRSRDYHVARGAQALELSSVLQQGAATTDCLTGSNVCEKNIGSFASLNVLFVLE